MTMEQKLWDEINILDEIIADMRARREEKLKKIRTLKTEPTEQQA
jgi:hypothetical protein